MATNLSFNDLLVIDKTNSNVSIGTTNAYYTAAGRTNLTVEGTSSSLLSLAIGGAAAAYLYAPAGRLEIAAVGATYMSLLTNGSERVRIDSTGNVGIGTTNPAFKFDINSNVAVIGPTVASSGLGGNWRYRDDTATVRWLTGIVGTAAATAWTLYDVVNSRYVLQADSSGNIGIGTISPSYKLAIENSDATVYASTTQAAAMASLRNTYGSAGNTQSILTYSTNNYSSVWNVGLVETGGGAYTGAYIWQNRTGASTWAERARIDSSGNLGIGTTSPSALLSVGSGNPFTVTSGGIVTSNLIQIGVGNNQINTTSAELALQYSTSRDTTVYAPGSSIAMIVKGATGVVGIGTSSPDTTAKLTVGGQLRFGGDVLPTADATYQLGNSSYRVETAWLNRTVMGAGNISLRQRTNTIYDSSSTTGWRKIATLLVDANDWQMGKVMEVTVRRQYATGGYGNEYATFLISTDGYQSTISTVFNVTYSEGFGGAITLGVQNFAATGTGATLYYSADLVVNVVGYVFYNVTFRYGASEFASAQHPGATLGIVFATPNNGTAVTAAADLIQYSTPVLFRSTTAAIGIGTASPNTTLHVAGATTFGGNLLSTVAQTWTLAANTSALNIASNLLAVDTTNNAVRIGSNTTRSRLTLVSATTDAVPSVGTASGALFLGSNSANYGLIFGVDGTGNAWLQSQRVDGTAIAYNLLLQPSGGNVGIGCSDPSQTLEARGTDVGIIVHYYNNARGGLFAFSTQRVAFASTSSSDNLVFGYTSSPGSTANFVERMRLTNSSGALSIGSSSVLGNSLLDVTLGITARDTVGVAPVIQVYNSGAGANLKTWRWTGNSDGTTAIQTINDAYTTAVDRLKIDTSGNVIVSTAAANLDLSSANGVKFPLRAGGSAPTTTTQKYYEEGTYTPATISGWTYVTCAGSWTRKGREVTLNIRFTGGTSSAVGGATVSTPVGLTPANIAGGIAVNANGTALGNAVCVATTSGTILTSTAVTSSAVDKVLTVTYEV